MRIKIYALKSGERLSLIHYLRVFCLKLYRFCMKTYIKIFEYILVPLELYITLDIFTSFLSKS